MVIHINLSIVFLNFQFDLLYYGSLRNSANKMLAYIIIKNMNQKIKMKIIKK
jgi:hypothetical protein